jgi:Protein of unknown function (DUF2877)
MTTLATTIQSSLTAPRILAAGSIAFQALSKSHGRAAPLTAFPDAPYLQAADQIIWVGVRPRSMHPRMLAIAEPIVSGANLTFDMAAVVSSPVHRHPSVNVRTLLDRAAELRNRAHEVGAPRGFGALLMRGAPPFPLDLAGPLVHRFAEALARNNLEQVESTAIPLLGLGSGLTPSGDDLVGGALFARTLTAPREPAWQRLGERIIAIAPTRTHAISAALLTDLIHGATYGVLHDLVDALTASVPFATVIDAARALTAIGHSSGWDMLTGFLFALDSSTSTKA